MIHLTCPSCHQRLRSYAEHAGKRMRCPNLLCGTSIDVPMPADCKVAEPAEPSESAEPAKSAEPRARQSIWVYLVIAVFLVQVAVVALMPFAIVALVSLGGRESHVVGVVFTTCLVAGTVLLFGAALTGIPDSDCHRKALRAADVPNSNLDAADRIGDFGLGAVCGRIVGNA